MAQAVISSASPGSPDAAIGVSGLARKFCTMTSWMWPCASCRSRSASSASTRSRVVSPMPIRIPEVNGIRSSPARRIIASRVRGRLSGACSWGPPGPQSRSDTDSSIIPWLADTSRSSASSLRPRIPAFGWGSSPVCSSTAWHIARRYEWVLSWPKRRSARRWLSHRASGRSPRVNSASLQPSRRPASATWRISSGLMVWARASPSRWAKVQ